MYAHTSLAPLHIRTPSHSPFNAHYSPHRAHSPLSPTAPSHSPYSSKSTNTLRIDTPTHVQNMFDHNIRVHKQIRSTSCLSQFLLKRSTPRYNRLLAQSCSTHKGTLDRGQLSKGRCVCCPNHIELCTDLCTSELGTPLYTGQPVGSRQCPLYKGSPVHIFTTITDLIAVVYSSIQQAFKAAQMPPSRHTHHH